MDVGSLSLHYISHVLFMFIHYVCRLEALDMVHKIKTDEMCRLCFGSL